jgi:Bacterial membrane protein YfhO
MGERREVIAFCACLAVCVSALFHETLFLGKVLSPADVLFVSASFRGESAVDYEPANRLLMDPVLQFQPWLEFNRRMIRGGRLPLWNGSAGCGAPHLANGQSAVFDPFHLLAYAGSVPWALGWMAACRLWVAGLGMFLLARQWGLGPWGRWFAGLAYPFSGFLVVWLLYPVTAVAVWMPWLFLATEGLYRAATARAIGRLAIVVALVVLGGHIQTSAHLLLAGGVYAIGRGIWPAEKSPGRARAPLCWALGACLGLGLASVQILPLAAYLAKSPVWSERQRERPAWWKVERPRLLEAVCTVVPYAFGSQRRGHPNLAKALGVSNLNESAGGFAGLGTILWLAPLAVLTRGRTFRVAFLAGLALSGALGAFRLPPVDNLLRALPVLEVTDNRRLTVWVSFALVLLGGIGLDQLLFSRRLARWWIAAWLFGAVLLGTLACGIGPFEGRLKQLALAHYRERAAATAGADGLAYEARALRQVAQALRFLPRYYGLVALELIVLATLALRLRNSPGSIPWARPAVMGLVLVDLAGLGWGLNPAIDAAIHAYEPPVISRLRQQVTTEGRALGIGEELPPNVLMRFGLSDIRNYDSVELATSLGWFAPLYEPAPGISSRNEITWKSVAANQQLLRESGVCGVVAAAPPPEGSFARVEKIGKVWALWLDGLPWARARSPRSRLTVQRDDGWAQIRIESDQPESLVVSETFDPGWTVSLDGKATEIRQESGVFMQIDVPSGDHHVIMRYDPVELKCGLALTLLSCIFLILVLTGIGMFWIPGITTREGLDGAEPAG